MIETETRSTISQNDLSTHISFQFCNFLACVDTSSWKIIEEEDLFIEIINNGLLSNVTLLLFTFNSVRVEIYKLIISKFIPKNNVFVRNS